MQFQRLICVALGTAFTVFPLLAQTHRPRTTDRCAQGNGWRKVAGKSVLDEGTVGYPLRGWVGYTNTGSPISGMTMECFTSDRKDRIASTTTDDTGNFSFPTLKPGTYYLTGTKKETGPDGARYRISAEDIIVSLSAKKSKTIVCLVADGEEDSD